MLNIISLIFSITVLGNTAYASSDYPANRSKQCMEFISKLPDNFFKGFVQVPENPAAPDGIKINVFYYGRIIEGKNTIAFFNGGPTSSSHGAYRNLVIRQKDNELRKDLPFIFIDQRGNGCSDPFPQGDSDEVLERLTHYGSRGIVNDAEVIRKKVLGKKPWIVYGHSFGGSIVRRYLQLFPQSIISVHSHGFSLSSNGYDRMYKRIVSQFRVQEIYLEKYPDDRKRLEILKKELTPNKCFEEKYTHEKVCGLESIFLLNDYLGSTSSWSSLHEYIGKFVVDGLISEKDIYEFLVDHYFTYPEDNDDPKNEMNIAFDVISYVDRNVITNSYESCSSIFEKAKENGYDIEKFYISECHTFMHENIEYNNKIQSLKKDHLTIDMLQKALMQNKHIPFYTYSGSLDSLVPVETFEEEISKIKNRVRYTNFPNSGHDGYRSEQQVWDDLVSEI